MFPERQWSATNKSFSFFPQASYLCARLRQDPEVERGALVTYVLVSDESPDNQAQHTKFILIFP